MAQVSHCFHNQSDTSSLDVLPMRNDPTPMSNAGMELANDGMERDCQREVIDDNRGNLEGPSSFEAPLNYQHHECWRIALYYLYFDLSSSQLKEHVQFQTAVCKMLDLNGRVRISQEGINGVLSGTLPNLRLYENRLTNALLDLRTTGVCDSNHLQMERVMDGAPCRINLDIKYCHLRTDLPVEQQLFDHLMVKETKTVISLFDEPLDRLKLDKRGKPSTKSSRSERRKERKKQELEQQLHQTSDDTESSDVGTSINSTTYMKSLQQAVMAKPLQPAPHLTAAEWNAMLDNVASDHSALLLDVRNVYESRVGHFSHPSTPTLLTNTRKYSDLPQLLAQNEQLQNPQTRQVFMYCTGGVRCERVSMLMQELYPDKEIYQLQGGIQKYLTSCSNQNLRHDDGNTVGDSDSSAVGNSHDKNCSMYFKGKNFVFDPRRTDPIHFGEMVGQCLVCGTPHDDYDNGHAPNDDKAARCNTCRMLVLICNECRPNYISHGEQLPLQQANQTKQLSVEPSFETGQRRLLYCNIDRCIHEGAAPEPELLYNRM